MNEQLIDSITNEVLRRLQSVRFSNQSSKKSMLVLSEENGSIPESIRKDYQIMETGRVSSLELARLYSMIDSVECILITSLTDAQLANLALGCGEGRFLEGIRYALLHGKTIFALEEGLSYRTYRKSAHKTYYRRLLEYEECIKSYGIEILEQKMSMPKGVMHHVNPGQEITYREEDNYTIDKKLIIEKDLMNLNLSSQKELLIRKNSIVSPSALDYARAHHIEIIKK